MWIYPPKLIQSLSACPSVRYIISGIGPRWNTHQQETSFATACRNQQVNSYSSVNWENHARKVSKLTEVRSAFIHHSQALAQQWSNHYTSYCFTQQQFAYSSCVVYTSYDKEIETRLSQRGMHNATHNLENCYIKNPQKVAQLSLYKCTRRITFCWGQEAELAWAHSSLATHSRLLAVDRVGVEPTTSQFWVRQLCYWIHCIASHGKKLRIGCHSQKTVHCILM